ncbi:LacI family DNA-binding transcriptional regulator [Candidatus Pantoea deserta]|uniref:LacI family DNA-binding transcriptional regulator n=1 Tax=Candidatus Pantoea deserta TaxID=1869313 RepID=A0A3N4NEH0_9GAMM|nr:LacI family DNA-binding transcriptional regulator [Pantoea deserta]RPD94551.1 LacI family DNA-binding transcriptional regulator [Pantoea deserta]
MATILEVAKRAGVSKATVSRVLSGNGYVSQETRDKVMRAVTETDFRPNLLARNLSVKSTQTIGLVVTNTLYSGNYFSELMSHSARMLEQQGRQLILADGKHSAAQERAAIDFLLDLRCDGIIIYPRFLTVDEMDEIIAQHKQPVLVVNRRLRQHHSYGIYADQKQIAAMAVKALIDLGHRDIAFITGSLDSPTGRERLAGYKAALEEQGIALRDALIAEGNWHAESGAQAAEFLLASGCGFSALVASNDEMALGAIRYLHTANIAVPAQVSVLGFDDIPLAPFTVPALSSVKIPVTEMVQEAIARLLAMLDGGDWQNADVFAASLMLRESVSSGPWAR